MADIKKVASKKTVTKKAVVATTEAEMQKELLKQRQDLADARRSLARGELVNPRVIGETRKEIARLMTRMNAKSATSTKKEDA